MNLTPFLHFPPTPFLAITIGQKVMTYIILASLLLLCILALLYRSYKRRKMATTMERWAVDPNNPEYLASTRSHWMTLASIRDLTEDEQGSFANLCAVELAVRHAASQGRKFAPSDLMRGIELHDDLIDKTESLRTRVQETAAQASDEEANGVRLGPLYNEMIIAFNEFQQHLIDTGQVNELRILSKLADR